MPKRLPLAALLALFAFALAGCGDSNGSAPEPDPARDSQAAGEPGERLPSRTGLVRWRLTDKETYDVFRQSSDYVYDPLTYWRRRSASTSCRRSRRTPRASTASARTRKACARTTSPAR